MILSDSVTVNSSKCTMNIIVRNYQFDIKYLEIGNFWFWEKSRYKAVNTEEVSSDEGNFISYNYKNGGRKSW